MATGRLATLIRIGKPVLAGLALAYFMTSFVDRPAPVHFQPENPYASKQAEILEPQTELVMERNIMKLGSPLSVRPQEAAEEPRAESNATLSVDEFVEEAISSANGTAQ